MPPSYPSPTSTFMDLSYGNSIREGDSLGHWTALVSTYLPSSVTYDWPKDTGYSSSSGYRIRLNRQSVASCFFVANHAFVNVGVELNSTTPKATDFTASMVQSYPEHQM